VTQHSDNSPAKRTKNRTTKLAPNKKYIPKLPSTTMTYVTSALFTRLLVKHRTIAKEGASSAEEEGDNTPIVASLMPKKKKKRKERTHGWDYVPAIDSASTYWDKGVEGTRKRTIANSSYCDDDARSDSESDPEDLFQPNKEVDASSESDDAVSAKEKVSLPLLLVHFPHSTTFFPNCGSPLT
jgi:hypothetical protein